MVKAVFALLRRMDAKLVRDASEDLAATLVRRQHDPGAVQVAVLELVRHAQHGSTPQVRDHALHQLANSFNNIGQDAARQIAPVLTAMEPVVRATSLEAQKFFLESSLRLLHRAGDPAEQVKAMQDMGTRLGLPKLDRLIP